MDLKTSKEKSYRRVWGEEGEGENDVVNTMISEIKEKTNQQMFRVILGSLHETLSHKAKQHLKQCNTFLQMFKTLQTLFTTQQTACATHAMH